MTFIFYSVKLFSEKLLPNFSIFIFLFFDIMIIKKISPFLDPTIMFDIEELEKMSDETLLKLYEIFLI